MDDEMVCMECGLVNCGNPCESCGCEDITTIREFFESEGITD